MKKYMYLCLAALSIGIFASCKAKKGVEATSTWLAIPFPEELDAIG